MADTNGLLASDEASITMFSGKGGVGKTTCAAATALHYSSSGKRTLAISTDATPSLSHIFEATGHEKPKRIHELLYVNELVKHPLVKSSLAFTVQQGLCKVLNHS